MDFQEALNLLKEFSACRLRIYEQFPGFPASGSQDGQGGYVVFADASVVNEPCYCGLRDFAKVHNLRITPFGHFLMVVSGQ
jgi:hypothetical protein